MYFILFVRPSVQMYVFAAGFGDNKNIAIFLLSHSVIMLQDCLFIVLVICNLFDVRS